jgi:hypothetical protein
MRRDFFVFYATAMASQFLDTFKEFPPRHEPASFSIDQIVQKLNDFLASDDFPDHPRTATTQKGVCACLIHNRTFSSSGVTISGSRT